MTVFQSTHSRGVRQSIGKKIAKREKFQSTHSRGVRQLGEDGSLQGLAISIHALTRSATLIDFAGFPMISDFNPRTHEECDE